MFAWASGNARKIVSAEQTNIARLRHNAFVPNDRMLPSKAAPAPINVFLVNLRIRAPAGASELSPGVERSETPGYIQEKGKPW
jgi:hypothetical protein